MRAWSLRRRRTVVPPLPSDDLLVTEENLRHALEDVLSVRERQIRGGVIVFRGDLRVDRSRALDALLVRLKPFGYTPFLKAEPRGVMVQAWPLGDWTRAARPGLAGLLVALPALVVGLMWSQVATTPANAGFGGFGYSLLTRLFVYLRFGALPDGTSIVTHPMADAAWVGCFVTALNLVPVGQLDGGRIAYALSARRHRMLGVVTWVVLLTLGALTGSVNWFVWAALLLFLVGFDHSP